jgi:hypothetical protein
MNVSNPLMLVFSEENKSLILIRNWQSRVLPRLQYPGIQCRIARIKYRSVLPLTASTHTFTRTTTVKHAEKSGQGQRGTVTVDENAADS